VFAVLEGLARFLVEFLRINPQVLFGLSQPQLWSLALIVLGLTLVYRVRSTGRRTVLESAPA